MLRCAPCSTRQSDMMFNKAESRTGTGSSDRARRRKAALAGFKSARKALADPNLFLNRELSQLEFNRRVLAQAEDHGVPLLERLRFLCIVSSNLDEFFEIRVASLKAQIDLGVEVSGADGAAPATVFRKVAATTHELVERQYSLWNNDLLPALAA